MSYDFNADEIFEMAEQIEKNGAAFYRKMGGPYKTMRVNNFNKLHIIASDGTW